MRLFGLNITRAARPVIKAPPLAPKGGPGDQELTTILPPFGTNPPERPVVTGDNDLSAREIINDPRELWYLALPNKLNPRQVLTILRSALGGDLWQQWQLCSLMLDSWPMFRKCSHELREAVSMVRYAVKPFAEENHEPTATAVEKADFVRRAFTAFRPNPFTDEKGFQGMVYDFTDGLLQGLMMEEILWQEINGEIVPRAAAWIHPRHFSFTNNGIIVLFDKNYNRMYWPLADMQHSEQPNPNKYICGQYMTRSGSSLAAGLMRPLAYDWSAFVFNREWMLNSAQKFGAPFLDVTYVGNSMDANELNKLDAMLEQAGSVRYFRHKEGTKVEILPAESAGVDNPQRNLKEEADKHCMFLLLGQESTTRATPGKLGGDNEKEKVKNERVQGLAWWVATDPLTQLARAAVRLNYGNEDEIPIIHPDYTETMEPKDQAELSATFVKSGVPLLAEEFYAANRLTMPNTGDLVLRNGQLGYLGDFVEIEDTPQPQGAAGGGAVSLEGGDSASARSRARTNAILCKASPEELQELEVLVRKAEKAPHPNGELAAVQAALTKIKNKRFRI